MFGWKYYSKFKEEKIAIAFADYVPIEFAVDCIANVIIENIESENSKPNRSKYFRVIKDGIKYYEIVEQVKTFFQSAIIAGHIKIYKPDDNALTSKYLFKGNEEQEYVKVTELIFAVKNMAHNLLTTGVFFTAFITELVDNIDSSVDLLEIHRIFEKYANGIIQDDSFGKKVPDINSDVEEAEIVAHEVINDPQEGYSVSQEIDKPTSHTTFEEFIPTEIIHKIKNLSFDKLKQQVVMLAAEKSKWDTSIMAAANIGILFYEEGLQKPATLEKFVSEYKKHLDKFPNLPDTTIKKIYKHLPEGYRYSRTGGKVARDDQAADITSIIKAAVYAGSIYDTDDVKKLVKLKAELVVNEYTLPSDDMLLKIIEAVEDI
jgi:hypothetical protein